jgi:hypothetical protein
MDEMENQNNKEINLEAQGFYPETPRLHQWVIKFSGGLVKDEKQANYVLIGFVALAVILSLILVFGGGSRSSRQAEYTPDTEYRGQTLPDNFR